MDVAPHRHLPERPPLVSVEVYPAAADRFPDVATILAPAKPSTPACWCLTYRITNAENHTLRGPDRPERLRGLCHADPPPGMIAYVDGVPAGWCSFGPRSSFDRLVKSRTIPHVDETPAWSVICFIVRPQFRRTGLSRALLDVGSSPGKRCGQPTGITARPDHHGEQVGETVPRAYDRPPVLGSDADAGGGRSATSTPQPVARMGALHVRGVHSHTD